MGYNILFVLTCFGLFGHPNLFNDIKVSQLNLTSWIMYIPIVIGVYMFFYKLYNEIDKL